MIKPLLLLVAFLGSFMVVTPAFAVANSCSVQSKQSFDVSFSIDKATLHETVMANQGGGRKRKRSLPLWSDDLSIKLRAVIADDEIQQGRSYRVWLKYVHSGDSNQKAGMLHYYLYRNSEWVLIDKKWADLNVLHSTRITLNALGDVISQFQCKAPDPEPPKVEYCELFPGPVQTWKGNTNNYHTSERSNVISYTKEHQIGFNNQIVKDLYPPDSSFKPETNVAGLCDGERCQLGGKMAENKLLRWSTSSVIDTIFSKDVRPQETYTAIPGTYFKSKGQGFHGLTVEKNGHLILPTGEYWFDSLNLIEHGDLTIEGKVVIHVRYQLNASSRINTDRDTDELTILAYYVGEHNINKSCPKPLVVGEYFPPQVNTDYAVNLNNAGQVRGRIYSRGPVTLANETFIRGAVTACQLQMTEQAEVIGDSACFTPPPAKDYQIEVLPEQDYSLTCDRQKVDIQVLGTNGQPATDYSGQVEVTTSLTTSGKAYWYQSEQGGDADKRDVSQSHNFAVDGQGKLTLWLKSDLVGTINATGTLSTDNTKADSGEYHFVPFKFAIAKDHLPVVAGKPVNIQVKAMSCASSDSEEVATGYSGIRPLRFNTVYDAPKQGRKFIQLAKSGSSDWQKSDISLTFTQGKADARLRYLDAGKATLNLYDPHCTLDGCEILPARSQRGSYNLGNWKRLEGSQSVWSRPYTFALCQPEPPNTDQPNIEQVSGTSSSGKGFVAAGETFHTVVKPVIWERGDSVVARDHQFAVDSSGMCGRMVTDNFNHSQAPAAQVSVVHALVSPSSEDGGVQGGLSGGEPRANTTLTKPFALSWSEVGSIKLTADTVDNYLGMDINPGYREVGRFYPKYLKLNSDSFSYPAGQSDFAYMDQPFSFNFSVGAFAKGADDTAGNAVKNYSLFADGYKADLELMVADVTQPEDAENTLAHRVEYATRSGAPYTWTWPGSAWEKGSNGDSQLNVDDKNFTFIRDYSKGNRSSSMRVSKPDGPFDATNTRMGLFIKPAKDPLDWSYTPDADEISELKLVDSSTTQIGQIWHSRPDIRYGRMVMEDVAGRSDSQLAIPLRTEYWNGTEFEIHRADSVSQYDGQYACKQLVAQSDGAVDSRSYTSGGGSVTRGNTESGQFIVIPHQLPLYREQVRFWQKLVSTEPGKVKTDDNAISCVDGHVSRNGEAQPWLLYNWRGLGDENPSALVTFGANRGNDRVIYRGEKGINSLLN